MANSPEVIQDDIIQLPLTDATIKAFLSSIVTGPSRADKTQIVPRGSSSVNGYTSAIKYLYKQQAVELPKTTQTILSDFMAGKIR